MVGEQLLSISYIISTLVSALVAFVAIVIADKFIAHNIEIKHSLIISLIALFLGPIIGSFINLPIPFFAAYILPLILWIVLGEILIKGADLMAKLKVMVVAFVVYIVLSWYVTPYILSAIPF